MKLLLFYSIFALTTFIICNAKEKKNDILKCDDDDCDLNPECCKVRTKLLDKLNEIKAIGGVKKEKVKRILMKKEQNNRFKRFCPSGYYICYVDSCCNRSG
ncbi:uncharacterized protein LOC101237274 [Hydra vulgaris]|uniref:uncharacterized protein LOC101237274 n=1 Tax=Hydra vulgaris TaxID=6087 RepID=UPI0002B4572D|nr:uncharacterized protein LOC101237274 [Hydra vulgaris]